MVYFVFTGVGTIDYMAYKGICLLQKADIVGYCDYIDESILAIVNKGVTLFDYRSVTYHEVNEWLYENKDKKVVVLLNGDFSIIGTAIDYCDYLREKHIPFEVVPGISAYSACSAVIAQESMLRNISKCLTITYVNEDSLKQQNIRKIAELHGSMAIYKLSADLTVILQRELLKGGFEKNTPVILATYLLRKNQSIIKTTIKEMHLYQDNVNHMTVCLVGWAFADNGKRFGFHQ